MIRLTAQAKADIQRIVARDKCEKRHLEGRSGDGLGPGVQVQQQFRAKLIILFRLCILERMNPK